MTATTNKYVLLLNQHELETTVQALDFLVSAMDGNDLAQEAQHKVATGLMDRLGRLNRDKQT